MGPEVSKEDLKKTNSKADQAVKEVERTDRKVEQQNQKIAEKLMSVDKSMKEMESNILAKFYAEKKLELEKLVRSPNVHMTDIIGRGNVKLSVDKGILEGLKTAGRILLFGPSGCGKTYITEGVANASDIKIMVVDSPEVTKKSTSASIDFLNSVFDEAKKQRCVLFLDEFDTFFTGDADRVSNFTTMFEKNLDILRQDNHGVLFFAATNIPEKIPTAIRNRFSWCFYFPLPTAEERHQYIQSGLTTRFTSCTAQDVVEFTQKTNRFSYRDLEELFKVLVPTAIGQKIEKTKFFRRQLVNQVPKFVPCGENDDNALVIDKVTEKDSIAVDVSRAMFLWVINQKKPQTTPERIAQFEAYAKDYGTTARDEELPF